MVSTEAAAAGVASLPSPIAQQGSELWFLWQTFATSLRFGTAVGFDAQGFTHFPFESKAMRKADLGEAAVVVLENTSTVGLNYVLMFRMLTKLS